LLFSTDDSKVAFDMSAASYLDTVCPMEMPSAQSEPVTMPTGVISLSTLKELPLDQQVWSMGVVNATSLSFPG